MPNAATIGREDGLDESAATAQRQPGDFARHPRTGAPWVTHPTEVTKGGWPGKKADLIALCAQRGIAIPEGKVTIAVLQGLLGPKARKVQYGRPSSLGKQIENMTNLQKWAERGVALGLFLVPDDERVAELGAIEGPITLDNDEARPILDKIAAAAKHRAGCDLSAERGTFIHKLLEVHDADAS
jgi:hypothetical protein